MLSLKMLLMKCQSTYDNMLLWNKPDEIFLGFPTQLCEFSVPWFIILSLAHVAFKKVMLKLKEQLKIVSRLLLQASNKPKHRHCTTGFLPYCRTTKSSFSEKGFAFCKQASNASSPFVWHSTVLKYLWSTDVNNIGLAQPITSPVRWRTEVFKSRGLSASVSFLPLPHPLLCLFFSFFWPLAPFSAQTKHRKSPPSVFLCFQTPRKRLLRRLLFFSVAGSLISEEYEISCYSVAVWPYAEFSFVAQTWVLLGFPARSKNFNSSCLEIWNNA